MDICKTCKHWQLNDEHKVVSLAALLEGRGEDLQTEKDIRKKMGFGIRECLHPKVTSDSRHQSIERDSVILDYDYESVRRLYTGEYFGCIHHERKPAHI